MAFLERKPEPELKPAAPRPPASGVPGAAAKPAPQSAAPQRPDPKKPDAKKPDPNPPAGEVAKSERFVSLDAFRGAVMLLLATEAFHLTEVLKKLNAADFDTTDWRYRAVSTCSFYFEHVAWRGGVLWDLIQPAFMFMVGAALPFSFARRAARGDSYFSRFSHALFRSLMLVLLGVFLASNWSTETNWKFTNVLAQIGLGYMFVFVLVNRGVWVQSIALLAIAGGWWYAFYQHPLPPPDFNYETVGVPPRDSKGVAEYAKEAFVLPAEGLPDLQAHWSMNTNFAADLDVKILNAFPRSETYRYDRGGYTTLNFVPSIITMILGLMIGELLRGPLTGKQKLVRMLIAAVFLLSVGVVLHYTFCPIVKRIWTPSWALASGGVVIALLALFYLVFDLGGWKRTAWPLVVVGMNPLVVYLIGQMVDNWIGATIKRHATIPWRHFAEWYNARGGATLRLEPFGGPFGPLEQSIAVTFAVWLICVWLYRQKIFVRM